ncbi:sulfite reductase subunit alpha [Ruixingdingia sedimenti]|uniref:NADPH--hemoprotein reductase n=1 Tax=Ruixingdingia sedimenti TaxID=3073604 RepID=A0ABU1F653_9RHOB|nr:sulfite reductase subunit alpha [Xinfangfangia sp. LG-4]MDR5652354.1 sulfite reductase subunit alpha [Xinfangfangia sp. LG-4]
MLSPDPADWLIAGAATAGWLALVARMALRRPAAGAAPGPDTPEGLLIGYASQTGFAEDLARQDADALAGIGPRVLPLDRIGAADLLAARRAVFIVSTTGDGDAPENAAAFLARVMPGRPALSHLSYALLALGDRDYPRFCGFGRAVDAWLADCGAQPLFPRVELDRTRPEALDHWRRRLAETLDAAPAGDGLTDWQLAGRRHLNPGSPGGGLYHLRLVPQGVLPHWQAGDIAAVEIALPDGTRLMRDYSLASLPASGGVELIVRRTADAAGRPGRGSDWLTRQIAPGAPVRLRLRANAGFRSRSDHAPMILIGNGAGLSGLLAHLRHRAALRETGPVWLIFGERTRRHDAIFDDELRGLQAAGVLDRLDRAFSRDGGAGPRYVQDLIPARAETLRAWIGQGADIHICGQRPMAQGVRAALEQVLGPAAWADLLRAGRCRTDVY